MRPYYEADGVKVFHAEWGVILPHIPAPYAVVTDQPFGTGWVRGGGLKAGEFHAAHERPDWDRWSTDWLGAAQSAQAIAAFCPNSRLEDFRAALGRPSSVAWWRKTNPRPNGPEREPVVIWPPLDREVEFAAYNGDTPLHPCQKPVDLMTWVIGLLPRMTVVDPFMGSGSTLVAAKNLCRECVGIEQDGAYCAVAVGRLGQMVLAL